ncbi:hypothetical protein QBC46DRAFT_61374 [Diplogelasinospora grovesii]|uniref:Transmembrane protein n=1 Tax=Diplogelasinospora grovesii TaxID=303347 RepID=A0AAN6S9A8_9PEZI|nr:hypothetical protein QBC46DRAFT_61374 [Diplogelasinospora grovesii]
MAELVSLNTRTNRIGLWNLHHLAASLLSFAVSVILQVFFSLFCLESIASATGKGNAFGISGISKQAQHFCVQHHSSFFHLDISSPSRAFFFFFLTLLPFFIFYPFLLFRLFFLSSLLYYRSRAIMHTGHDTRQAFGGRACVMDKWVNVGMGT